MKYKTRSILLDSAIEYIEELIDKPRGCKSISDNDLRIIIIFSKDNA